MLNGYQRYKDLQVQTASGGQLILLLYQGAIKFLNRARRAIEERDVEGAHNSLIRAQDIVLELSHALDKSAGPVATNLERIYDYLYRRLVYANVHKDVAAIDEVLKHLRDLHGAWEHVLSQAPSGTSPEPTAPVPPAPPAHPGVNAYRAYSTRG
jgi:flagellar protein FliS